MKTYQIPDSLVPVVDALLASAGIKSSGPSEDWRYETGFPKEKTIKGAMILLQAPVNPEWEPSQYAKTFGQQGYRVVDPSMPPGARSPSGYPTYRGIIMFGDETFKNEDELAKWRGAVAAQGNQGDLDAQQQAVLQPWQIDVKKLDRAQLEDLLYKLGHGESQTVFRNFGPTKLIHPLSLFMSASGINDIGYMSTGVPNGMIVPPEGWPELGDMTVARAKELAGLA